MITFIGGAFIFAGLAYIGMLVRNQFRERLIFMEYMYNFATYMLREVKQYKSKISDIVNNYCALYGKDKLGILDFYINKDKLFNSIYESTDNICLRIGDRNIITSFLSNLGKGIYSQELMHIEQFISDITRLTDESKERLSVQGKLAVQLLTLLGFAVMIIVI